MKKNYDKTVGYSPLECVDPEKMQQVIRVNKSIIDGYYSARAGDILLVAGAGQGQEAVLIAREYELRTIGVDINIKPIGFSKNAANPAFQRQDLMALGFKENTFSVAYSYHVLEHVSDPVQTLHEIHRVLKPGGILFIGFPNKHRLVSYIGTSQKASWREKIAWNLNDYLYRLKGKFENKHGAHAGFTESEFKRHASGIFETIHPHRNEYMLLKYPRLKRVMRLITAMGMGEFMFPSNYYVCIKGIS